MQAYMMHAYYLQTISTLSFPLLGQALNWYFYLWLIVYQSGHATIHKSHNDMYHNGRKTWKTEALSWRWVYLALPISIAE